MPNQPPTWKWPQHHSQNDSEMAPQPVTYRGTTSLPKAPARMKNTSQRSHIRVETFLFAPNVLGICSEQMLTHTWHHRKQYKNRTNKHVVFCGFVTVFFSVSKSRSTNNWHVQGGGPDRQPVIVNKYHKLFFMVGTDILTTCLGHVWLWKSSDPLSIFRCWRFYVDLRHFRKMQNRIIGMFSRRTQGVGNSWDSSKQVS